VVAATISVIPHISSADRLPDVCARWKEYIEEQYDKEDKSTDEEMNIVKPEDADSIGPDIMYNEFEKALSEL